MPGGLQCPPPTPTRSRFPHSQHHQWLLTFPTDTVEDSGQEISATHPPERNQPWTWKEIQGCLSFWDSLCVPCFGLNFLQSKAVPERVFLQPKVTRTLGAKLEIIKGLIAYLTVLPLCHAPLGHPSPPLLLHLLQILKDPTKPKAKGNFWTVDVDLIPPEALKLQNTAVSRQEERTFTVDLAPFIYHGWAFQAPQPPLNGADPETSGFPSSEGSCQSSPFSIDALLHDFQGVGLSGKARAESPTAASKVWGTVPIFRVSSGAPLLPWRAPGPLPIILQPSPETSDSDSREGTPPPAAPFWEQLPTSYTPCLAPNVVVAAPQSHGLSFPPNPAFPPYGPMPFPHPAYWELMPRSSLSPGSSSRVDLGLEEAMPPNKTVFDVWMSHPMDIVHPAFPQRSPSPQSSVVTHYDPS
uniref:Uncharacterized protein n=1 Tax=Laticauda laticaudata TaxID=8630 RepID=A0A8C5WQE2_LATLA